MYTSLNDYIKKTYGRKMYKLSISSGLSCPNRQDNQGGCIFCSAGGSGDFATLCNTSITNQINAAKHLVSKKFTPTPGLPCYIAYFQAFTNTYGPIEYLRKIFYEAINNPDIAILSIATRPDCLGADVIDLLDELNQIKPVWIELGLQTIHETTARFINRGYTLSTYDNAVKALKAININIIVHTIIGLPINEHTRESDEMIYETINYICNSGINGIKISLLYILHDTVLEKIYEKGYFKALTKEEYYIILKHCIKLIPKDIVIHRITGDGPKNQLIAPLWTANKRQVMNELHHLLQD